MRGRFADAVIVAAGSSARMGGADKLNAMLLDRPLLAWSVATLAAASVVDRLVVVARPDRMAELANAPWIRANRATVVAGGETRSDSVRAGVEASSADVVLVHDGARPLVSAALAEGVARAAAEHGAAVPVIAVADSLKRAAGGWLHESVERDGLMRTQTPQGVRRELLLGAFERAGRQAASSFTDEAALLEAAGVPVATIPGEAANIKVTDPTDLELVRAIVAGRSEQRVGFGEDVHGFGPENGLMLGGIEIAEAPRLHGHSDGDVALHALATALLAACGLGDLGRLFPSDDSRTAGIASAHLVTAALDQALAAGWRVSRAQVAIVGSRPKLGSRRLDEMRDTMAAILGIDADAMAVTASTGNLSGPEGAGRVLRASALATVVRR